MDGGPAGSAGPLYERVLDLAGAGPGMSVLDLGCGTGEFAAVAVARGARVMGVDVDPSAVAAATVPGAEFLVGDAHDPPLGPFDLVTAVQLLEHVANPVAVLRAAARRAPVIAATTWAPEAECDARLFGEALAAWLPPKHDGPPPLRNPGRFRRIVGIAGLRITGEETVDCPFTYPDAEALLRPLLGSGIGRIAARRAGEPAVRRAVLDHLSGNRTKNGGFVLHDRFQVLVTEPE